MMRGGQGGDERHRIIKIKIMEINRAGALGVDEHLPAARGPKEQVQGPPGEPFCWDPRSVFRGLAVLAGSCRPRGGRPSGCTPLATSTWLAMPKTGLLSALLFLEENS